jgi:hypothetical protein
MIKAKHNKFRLANDPETELHELENLADNENELIRAAVALNPSATTSILVKIFSDESEHPQECLRKRNDTKH